MANSNAPRGRKKTVSGTASNLAKHGEGLGTGPVGKQDAYAKKNEQQALGKKPQQTQRNEAPKNLHSSSSNMGERKIEAVRIEKKEVERFAKSDSNDEPPQRSFGPVNTNNSSYNNGGGRKKISLFKLALLVIAVVLVFNFVGKLFGGNNNNNNQKPNEGNFDIESVIDQINSGSSSSGWTSDSSNNTSPSNSNSGNLNSTVSGEARAKYTKIKGNGKDQVTIMVYMCGADLESRSALGTKDIMEMCNADLSDKVNLIIYTGGSTKWNNNIISEKTNQIYKVENGGVACLSDNEGKVSMTKPSTLSGFIKYCASNYPADRYELIFWDHGGGSISGYGYDEKFPNDSSMTLAGINTALKDGGVKFDFIGFDACLMATAENGLMLANYGDFMIASEETEPGYGWYYTNWLNLISKNTSTSTLEIGKQIVDDFIRTCKEDCPGQNATLSVTDLAELQATLPAALSAFAADTTELINNEYKTVSNARNKTREFSTSGIDQVDLTNLALNIGSNEGKELAEVVKSAVKYNKVSSKMTNAYGLSIYFPYKATSYVKSAVSTYAAIGMDDEYSRCIQAFAGVTGTAQSYQSNTYSEYSFNPSSILQGFGSSDDYSGSYHGSGYNGYNSYSDFFSQFLSEDDYSSSYGSSYPGYSGYSGSSSSYGSSYSYSDSEFEDLIEALLGSYLSDRSLVSTKTVANIVKENSFDAGNLKWAVKNGQYVLTLDADQWNLVRGLDLNVFYDDGEGYIDLGLDNIYEITKKGELLGEYDGSWLAVGDQIVAYYHLDTFDDGENYSITGRVPVLYNGKLANLIIVFDNENEDGYIAGITYDYSDTAMISRNLSTLEQGDVIEFICDYYTYDGEYQDSYRLGYPITIGDELPEISNLYLPDTSAAVASYLFTDIFAQEYWTPLIP